MIGMYSYGGGTTGEFAVRWYSVGGKSAPRLEVFDDAWHALSMFQDLLARMAELDGRAMSPTQFIALLKELRIQDLTEREAPAGAGGTREFHVVVTERDVMAENLAKLGPDDAPPAGPIVFEAYLNHATPEHAARFAERLGGKYGWTRVGRLIVEDWPE